MFLALVPNSQDGATAQRCRLPIFVPAPLLYFPDLVDKVVDFFHSLAEEVRRRVITPPKPVGAVRNGTRTKTVITIFGIPMEVKVQRFKSPDGRTWSQDGLTLPQGRYDIGIVEFAVLLYSNGISAELTAKIVNAAFRLNISEATVLNWVKRVAELGYEEHRRMLEALYKEKNYTPKQVGMDELYFTMPVDGASLGISYLVDLERSLILDVYVFSGNNISSLDVSRVYNANREYLDGVEILTADGAKAYDYLAELTGNAVRVTCTQHKVRNTRKRGIVKRLIEKKVNEEAEYLEKTLAGILRGKERAFRKRTEYVLPQVIPVWLRRQ